MSENRGLDWRNLGYHLRSVLAVVIAVGVLGGGGYFIYTKASDAWTEWRTADDYVGEGEEEISVLIPPGASMTRIADILVDHDVIKSRDTFRSVARDRPQDVVSYGRYRLMTQIPASLALDMLMDPDHKEILTVRLVEGLAMSQQFERINTQLGIPIEDLEAAATSENLGNVPEWAGDDLEGLMFPDTYNVDEPVDPSAILRGQVGQFNTVADAVNLEGGAADLGYDPHEVLTIASIIEREVNQEEYRAMVSGVIYNRLADDMMLQMDSTVHYAVGRFDTVTTTPEERETDSPYNTYRYTGLPPGPISNPGRASIEAALNPADTDARFFVTVNLESGETKFAETLEEHEANVAEFQAWCQENPGTC